MVSPITVPGNQPVSPASNSPAVNAGSNLGRRGSQSLSSSTFFSPFSPPGGTSVAAAAALGTSPPMATNMNLSSSGTTPGFGGGFLTGSGLGRSISNGKQMGQQTLMSPNSGGAMAVNDKDARGQGILRRLSLGAGAARPNFGKPPAVISPSAMPPATDNSVDHSQTDITSSANYFNTLPPPQGSAASPPSAVTSGATGKPVANAPSFYANPFSGAVLHEAHDEHEHDLAPGMSALNLGKGGQGADGLPYRRASSAVLGTGNEWNPGSSALQDETGGVPRSRGEQQDGTARPRKISFGWSGFMHSRKETGQPPKPPLSDAPNNRINDSESRAPPASILVRRESGPASPPGGTAPMVVAPQDSSPKYKFGHVSGGEDKTPVSITVQQVSLAPSVATTTPNEDLRGSTLIPHSPRPLSTETRGTRNSPTTATTTGTMKAPSGMLGPGSTGARGRRGSEAGAGGQGGKKRSVSPMAEHLLRGGPGQF